MSLGRHHPRITHWALAFAALLTAGLAAASPALARPVLTPVANPASPLLVSTTGSCTVSIEASAQTVAQGSSFRYTVRIAAPDGAGPVTVRFQLLRANGRLIYQRTRAVPNPDGKVSSFAFERPIDGLGMDPGVYPVRLDIESACENTSAVAVLESDLVVHDPEDPRVPVVVAVRVPGQPLSNPDGLFIGDPGRFTRARDDLHMVLDNLLANPASRMTLAISPLLLEEWRKIADSGYELAGPEGVEKVAADSEVGRAYAEVLGLLKQALGTGRLRLAWQGYADPDLDALDAHGLSDDIETQYERGLSAVFASTQATTSPITVPAGGGLPESALASLVRQGVTCMVAEPGRVRTSKRLASPGAYRTRSGLKVLVADREASTSIAEADLRSALARALEFQQDHPSQPLVITAILGSGALDVSGFTRTLDGLLTQPWTNATDAISAAQSATAMASFTQSRMRDGAPAGYWKDVDAARASARALSAALPPETARSAAVRDNWLIAESSSWAGFDGSWALADSGRAFSLAVDRIARSAFDPVRLTIRPVTLAGDAGDVPITIKNTGAYTLNLRLVVDPGPGVTLAKTPRESIVIPPKESFFEVPVRLSNTLQGAISVKLMAGDTVLDQRTVRVSASYLDRLAMIAAVLIALAILLAYIIRRVRRAENAETTSDAVH